MLSQQMDYPMLKPHLEAHPPQKMEEGQGLVEYALILVLVAVVVIGILSLLGPALQKPYADVLCTLHFGRSAQVGHTLDSNGEPILNPDLPIQDADCYFQDESGNWHL